MTSTRTPQSITANSVLPADRRSLRLGTADGLTLVGEVALPEGGAASATIVCVHPLPTHGGMMDSHVLRKMSWRLPALADIAVVRFNTRGTTSASGTSEGTFDAAVGEGEDLRAAIAEAASLGTGPIWLLGWSFGTDVVLKHGNVDPVAGAILLSPPLRYTSQQELAAWNGSPREVVAFVPEHDDFLPPTQARAAFAVAPGIRIEEVPDAKHLWVGERFVTDLLDRIVNVIRPGFGELPRQWDGPMDKWSDL
ncbi:MAG: alpha/beta hydrolase [Candidatus Nanopelagicales bacterium]|jgi:alpha/beta superfamily hydrolase